MKKSLYIAATIVLIASLGLWVAQSKKKISQNLKIGGAFALTGDAAAWGEASKNGAELAVEEINAHGGVGGKKLELAIEDTRSSSKDTVSAVQKLKSLDHARAFLVSWLDVYQGAESILEPGDIMISPDGGAEAINGTQNHPGVFTTWYRTGPKSDLAVKFMAEHGAKTLYLITENDSYYEAATNFMRVATKKYGVTVVGQDTPGEGADIRTVLAKAAAKKPDAVFFAFYDENKNAQFLNLYKNYFGEKTIVFGDELTLQNYASGKFPAELFNNIYFYGPRKPVNTFTQHYKERFSVEPVFGASTTYDAVYILAQMFAYAPSDPDTYLKSRSFNTKSFGEITFDQIGGVETKENYFSINQIQNGLVVEVVKPQ